MNKDEAVDLFLEQVRLFSDSYLEVDPPCDRMLSDLGSRGIDALTLLLRDQVDTDDESVACYCVVLLIGSDDPRNVEIVSDALSLPFANTGVRDEVRESIFNDAVTRDRFLNDARFLAAAREIGKTWHNSQLDQFLKIAGKRFADR